MEPLHPQVQQLLALVAKAGEPSICDQPLHEARQRPGKLGALTGSGPRMAAETTQTIGPRSIPVRLYEPGPEPGAALVVYLHGGGWTVGALDDYDAVCRRLAAASGCDLLSVDYRLAPEHPFPAGLDDALEAFDWALTTLAADRPVVLAGDSAGANLATVVARHRADADVRLQVLVYPVCDHDLSRPSYAEHGDSGYPLGAREIAWFWDQYVPDPAQRAHPDASPLRGDLSGLPPALVIVAEHDPLRDEAIAYGEALARAGVDVQVSLYPDVIHGFFHLAGHLDRGDDAIAEVATAIRVSLDRPRTAPKRYDAVIVGAGFSGLYMLKLLRDRGFTARVLEAGDGVGGTWFWNRYPGARCDIESLSYSYSFDEDLQQEWEWTERYAAQPEILKYLEHVADRFELRDGIQLNTRVRSACFDDATGRWQVEADSGETFDAQYCVMATGCLNVEKLPEINGIESFAGECHHTSNWPAGGVDLRGKRVGLIGTGSTGIQAVPELANEAAHLYVFQRTPNFCYPARNHTLDPDYVRQVKAGYADYRRRARISPFGTIPLVDPPRERLPSAVGIDAREREEHLEVFWEWGHAPSFMACFQDVLVNEESNDLIADFFRRKMRERVTDPELAERLLPWGFAVGTKRMCLERDYFETYNRENVTLVDLRDTPIDEVVPDGIRTSEQHYALDALVLATGFDAMTGSLLAIDIRGAGGVRLRDDWADGPRTLLGLQVAGFPNLFTITGPLSPSVLSNMVMSLELHVEWIAQAMTHVRDIGGTRIEARGEAQDRWVEHAHEAAQHSLFGSDRLASSWYTGANVQGKAVGLLPYVGGSKTYKDALDATVANSYADFLIS